MFVKEKLTIWQWSIQFLTSAEYLDLKYLNLCGFVEPDFFFKFSFFSYAVAQWVNISSVAIFTFSEPICINLIKEVLSLSFADLLFINDVVVTGC